jgi:hypothetical protein
MKTINVKKIAQDYQDSEKHDLATFCIIKSVLEPFHGKKLTAREHKKIYAELERLGYSSPSIDIRCKSWIELSFYDEKTPATTNQGEYRKREGFKFTLGYVEEMKAGFNTHTFYARNKWASEGAPNRIKQIDEAVSQRKVEAIQEAYDMLAKAIQLLEREDLSSYYIPFSHELERQFGFKIERVKN